MFDLIRQKPSLANEMKIFTLEFSEINFSHFLLTRLKTSCEHVTRAALKHTSITSWIRTDDVDYSMTVPEPLANVFKLASDTHVISISGMVFKVFCFGKLLAAGRCLLSNSFKDDDFKYGEKIFCLRLLAMISSHAMIFMEISESSRT